MSIAKIFGKSPFTPLQTHMQKVAACVEKLEDLLLAIDEEDKNRIALITKEISHLEHEADLTKNNIRNHLPRSLFMPIDREDILEILTLQDSIADKAEDIAIVLSIKRISFPGELKNLFPEFWKKNMETFRLAKRIINEFEDLLESSFGGMEAQKVREMVHLTAKKEHEADKLQYALIKELYKIGDSLPFTEFHLWMSLIKEVAAISNLSEKLGNRIRMILELK